jgi:membrane protease YdiL (CAAX protease family)
VPPGQVLLVTLATTAVVAVLSYRLPPEHAATGVGLAFLGATWALALRGDGARVRHFGLSLGGLLEPEPLAPRRILRDALVASAWALGLALVILPPFAVGFRLWWHPALPFHLRAPASPLDDGLGQLLVIALPEEAFYRGWLMTSLDDAWGTRVRVLGARLGPGWLVSSALFALGHVVTEPHPSRLAVFFPALLFGWLRARTGGVGASAVLHAVCNLFAATMARGYGLGG